MNAENYERGISLIELVIALALASVLSLFFVKIFDVYRSVNQTMESDEEVLQVKSVIMSMLNCNSTVSRNDGTRRAGAPVDACNFRSDRCPAAGGGFLAVKSKLRDKNGVPQDLIPLFDPRAKEAPTKGYRRISLRAQCVCCEYCFNGKGVLVEYKNLSVNWAKWKPLFGDEKSPDRGIKLGCAVP